MVHQVLKATSPSLLQVVSKRFAHNCSENWHYRAKMILACPDYKHFSPVPGAGKIIGGSRIMHNGLKIVSGSYYGPEADVLFSKTKGVHEPQEERIFEQVLKLIKPGSTMVELGSYWAFYSMWFAKEVVEPRLFMVEPVRSNLEFGKRNFVLNGFSGDFNLGYVGGSSSVSAEGTPVICVDDFIRDKEIEHIAILHCDIQGFELEMLKGAEKAIQLHQIDYFFISTHSEQLHSDCEEHLRHRGLRVISSINLSESYSVDGVLVCADAAAPLPPPIELSRRPPTA
jgi:hypothetical protein